MKKKKSSIKELKPNKIGFQSLKKFRPYTRYAEHPFVEAVVDGTKVNIVPCYNVKRENGKVLQTDLYIIQNSCHKNYLTL